MDPARSCFLAAAVGVGIGLAPSAMAYEFRTQWVYRLGAGESFDVVPASSFNAPLLGIAPGTPVRFQLQFGVFDNAVSEAPAGGYLGWISGTLAATGGTNSRTPGRIPPFRFASDPPGNGLPSNDPWTMLTQINNTLGPQEVLGWFGIDGTNDPGPPPPAVVRARNEFVSTYEITSVLGTADYTITAAGSSLAAQFWSIVGQDPPDPGGDGVFGPPGSPENEDDIDGRLIYAPSSDFPGQPIASPLNITIPGPSAPALLLFAGLIAVRRREGFLRCRM